MLDLELEIILSHEGGHDEYTTEPVTLFLKITESSDLIPSSSNTLNPTSTNRDGTIDDLERGPVYRTIQASGETTQHAISTAPLLRLSRTSDLAIESSTSVQQIPGSQTEVPRIALRRAEEALNTMETWGTAVGVVKRVMDAVSPIAAVGPISCLRVHH
jgi:hypothetical protein